MTFIFVTINDVFWKVLQIVVSAGVWISFPKVSRLDVAKQKSYTVPSIRFHEVDFLKILKFPKYWRWWRVEASKFMKFARWRDFNALRRAHVSFTWLVEWLHPKSNIVYRGNCSTKGGRLIHRFSNYDLHFRYHKWCILKSFANRCVRRCLNFISQSITAGRGETKKLHGAKHPFPWGRFFENLEISKILTLVKGWGL